jgi:SLT domain-containing protein
MKALAILATVALVLLGRWWRDALSDARLAAVDEEDQFVPMAADWALATGGPVSAGSFYLVGESGRETVVLPRGSYLAAAEWRN